jgi:hypothetical protein
LAKSYGAEVRLKVSFTRRASLEVRRTKNRPFRQVRQSQKLRPLTAWIWRSGRTNLGKTTAAAAGALTASSSAPEPTSIPLAAALALARPIASDDFFTNFA